MGGILIIRIRNKNMKEKVILFYFFMLMTQIYSDTINNPIRLVIEKNKIIFNNDTEIKYEGTISENEKKISNEIYKMLEIGNKDNSQKIITIEADSTIEYENIWLLIEILTRNDIEVIRFKFDGYEKEYLSENNSDKHICNSATDSIYCLVIIKKREMLLGFDKGDKIIIKDKNNKIDAERLKINLRKLYDNHKCAPDIDNLLIAAEKNIKFDKLRDVIRIGHICSYHFQSFAKMKE